MMKKYLSLMALVLFVALGFIGGRKYETHRNAPQIETKTDTLIVVHRDTINQFYPIEKTRYVYDTIRVAVASEPIVVRDTTFVDIPSERVTYEDSTYTAVVSGYRPVLESMRVYQKEKVVTIRETEPMSPWYLGVMAGYDWTLDGMNPYVGAIATYSFHPNWSVGVTTTCDFTPTGLYPLVSAGVTFVIPTK